MSATSLLLWMSARSQGSWAQFRSAVEELHVGDEGDVVGEDDDAPDQFAMPLYQALKFNLQRLGHAEFFAGAGDGADWRVTPPTLAMTRHGRGALGIVIGARSIALIKRVRETSAGIGVILNSTTFPGYPEQLLFAADDAATLAKLAERADLIFQSDAPAALLMSLPPVDDPCVRRPAQLPLGAGWRIDRFSPDDLSWRSATLDDAALASGGLFRFALGHQRHMLLCQRGAAYRVPGQVGKFLVLKRRRRNLLRYDRQSGSLSVPAGCRPPFLIERALILCSGSPPIYEGGPRGGVLHYAEIPDSIAAIAAALLRQELQ